MEALSKRRRYAVYQDARYFRVHRKFEKDRAFELVLKKHILWRFLKVCVRVSHT